MTTITDGYTPTQRKMLALLGDGQPHRVEELKKCLLDDLSSDSAVRDHLSQMRKLLRLEGKNVLCVWWHRCRQYQLVRAL